VTAETATGEPRHLAVACHPDRVGPDGTVETVLVLVEDVTPYVVARRTAEAAAARHEAAAAAQRATAERLAEANRQLLAANRELTDALDRLREQSDDLRLATAEAQVAAEEIETLNEELQASNEELETLHEEAQATVEELNLANDELQARAAETEELAAAHAGERARLAAVLAGMGDAVLVVDRGGRAVLANAAWDELAGSLGGRFVPADGRGVPLPEAGTPQARAARGEAFRLDFTATAADGTRRWFEATGRPLPEDEAGAGVVVVRDITERSLRRLQERFVAVAAHELRTPLTTLSGVLQMLARRVATGGDERLNRHVAAAREQVRRLADLVGELTDVSRLQQGGAVRLERAPLDLAAMVRAAAETAEFLADGQERRVDVPPVPVPVDGDARRLEQVLLNLLANAFRHAGGGARVDLRLRRDGETAVIEVADDGPGIPAEVIPELFAPFAQGGGTAARTGLGLGLYIAREIARAHGGDVEARSAPGAGATFAVGLPLLTTDEGNDGNDDATEEGAAPRATA
jgi:two-component system CheB/CheR fusion protein